jgi:predicted dinucleotide-binding enzyme
MGTMRIGIVGTGHVGGALAKRLVKLGYEVRVANSRGPDSLQEFAKATGARAVDIASISAGAEVLIIAIQLERVRHLPNSIATALPEKAIVVDAGNYYPLRDGAIPAIDQGLPESEWVSQQLGVPVVKAFNSIIASRLADQGKPAGDPHRIALPVAGDDLKARAAIMKLVEHLGFSAFDAGLISESWRQQPGQPAYCTDPTPAELPSLLDRADRAKSVRNRDKATKILAQLPSDYPADQLVQASRFTVGLDRKRPRSWLVMLRLGLTLARAKHERTT